MSQKHAQELLPILCQATAGCEEVGAASRNQLCSSLKRAFQGPDPTKWSPRVLVHDHWQSQYLLKLSCMAGAQLPSIVMLCLEPAAATRSWRDSSADNWLPSKVLIVHIMNFVRLSVCLV